MEFDSNLIEMLNKLCFQTFRYYSAELWGTDYNMVFLVSFVIWYSNITNSHIHLITPLIVIDGNLSLTALSPACLQASNNIELHFLQESAFINYDPWEYRTDSKVHIHIDFHHEEHWGNPYYFILFLSLGHGALTYLFSSLNFILLDAEYKLWYFGIHGWWGYTKKFEVTHQVSQQAIMKMERWTWDSCLP